MLEMVHVWLTMKKGILAVLNVRVRLTLVWMVLRQWLEVRMLAILEDLRLVLIVSVTNDRLLKTDCRLAKRVVNRCLVRITRIL